MKILKLSFPILSCILLAAHFSRISYDSVAVACLVFPLVLFSKKQWVMRIFQLFLLLGGIIWIERAIFLARLRHQLGQPWIRLTVILGVVALFTLLSAWVFNTKKIREIFNKDLPGPVIPSIISCVLTAGLLSIIQLKVKTPVLLLAERFLPGAGWIEILVLALYAGWITEKILPPRNTPLIRSRIWALFSVVFFLQLLLGLGGIAKLLMTGTLHLPVPALIIAGPLFRGDGFFMLILFGATLLLVGPAWCSYLCYIGAWDHTAAKTKKIPVSMPPWRHALRVGILVLVVLSALLLKFLGLPGSVAVILAAIFGVLGAAVMVVISRKLGTMVHCTTYCPIGLVANWFGRLSPFRIKMTTTCTECGACRPACRYEALSTTDIKNRKPGLSCTLCGDCLTRCQENALQYHFPGMKPHLARYLFIIITVSLHAVFLGVARL